MDSSEQKWRRDVAQWMSTVGADLADLEEWIGCEVIENLFASSPLGFALLDRNLRFRRVNDVFAATTGLTVEEHRGRTPMELL